MTKIRKFGRRFLTTTPNNTDAVFWTASYNNSDWRIRPAWNAAFGVIVGRTGVKIHSSNEENDVNFEQFLRKLTRLEEAITEFIRRMDTFDKDDKKIEAKRIWLNDEDEPGVHYFNGYVAMSFSEGDFDRLTLADCHRSIIFDFDKLGGPGQSQWMMEGNAIQMERLETILTEIEEFRVNIDTVIREVDKLPVKKPQVKKPSPLLPEITHF